VVYNAPRGHIQRPAALLRHGRVRNLGERGAARRRLDDQPVCHRGQRHGRGPHRVREGRLADVWDQGGGRMAPRNIHEWGASRAWSSMPRDVYTSPGPISSSVPCATPPATERTAAHSALMHRSSGPKSFSYASRSCAGRICSSACAARSIPAGSRCHRRATAVSWAPGSRIRPRCLACGRTAGPTPRYHRRTRPAAGGGEARFLVPGSGPGITPMFAGVTRVGRCRSGCRRGRRSRSWRALWWTRRPRSRARCRARAGDAAARGRR
jgi:hypothetical protein